MVFIIVLSLPKDSKTIADNGLVYETFGISKRFPIKLQIPLIRAELLDKPLSAKCFIHVVVASNLIYLITIVVLCVIFSDELPKHISNSPDSISQL